MTTRSSSHRLAGAAVLVVALALAGTAGAEPNAADVETARGLYVEGLELRDAGRLEVSLARFKAAHALAATPITSLELGRAHALLAQLVEAREVLLSVERMPPNATESPKAANARLEARKMADLLRERIPAIRIVFNPAPQAPPQVTIDGTPIPPEALATPRKVNPGNHVVVADSNGSHATASVLLVEREVRTVALSFEPPGSSANQATSPTRSDTTRPPEPDRAGPTPWFYVGLGTAGVGIVVGTITGALALSKASTLESECTGSACPRSAESDLNSSRTMGTVSTIAFGVAGAGLVIVAVAWLTRPSAGTQVRTTPNLLRWSW